MIAFRNQKVGFSSGFEKRHGAVPLRSGPLFPVSVDTTPSFRQIRKVAPYEATVSSNRGVSQASSSQASSMDPPKSADPMYSDPASLVFTPGKLFVIHSEQDLQKIQSEHKDQLVVLMCKASHCRPCKMFTRKYMRIAEKFFDTVFLDIVGDESKETRSMMIGMGVKVTPTFFFYQDGELVHTITGINENKLCQAIAERMPADSDYCNLCVLDSYDDDAKPSTPEVALKT